MNYAVKLELLYLHVFCICFQKCYIGCREYPYGDFKPTTKINSVVKVEVCLVCYPITRPTNCMAEYTEKKPQKQLEMTLYLSCMNSIMASYFP